MHGTRGTGAPWRPLPRAARVENRLCGDAVTVYLATGDAGTAHVGFESDGCSLCRASASILAEAADGLDRVALMALVAGFRAAFAPPQPSSPAAQATATGAGPSPSAAVGELYELRRFPTRERCVLLPWEALAELLNHPVPTEEASR